MCFIVMRDVKRTFSKSTADARTFSKVTTDFSKVREPFFSTSRSFYSKVTADVTKNISPLPQLRQGGPSSILASGRGHLSDTESHFRAKTRKVM